MEIVICTMRKEEPEEVKYYQHLNAEKMFIEKNNLAELCKNKNSETDTHDTEHEDTQSEVQIMILEENIITDE